MPTKPVNKSFLAYRVLFKLERQTLISRDFMH